MAFVFAIAFGIRVHGVEIQNGAADLYAGFMSESDTEQRWCRWSLSVPGVSMDETGGTALSGISKVDFVTLREEGSPTYVRQYIVVRNFRDLCDLWIYSGKTTVLDGTAILKEYYAKLESTEIMKMISTDGTKTGLIRQLYKFDQTDQKNPPFIKFETFNDTKTNYLMPAEATVNASGNLELFFNTGVGYIVYLGSTDGKLPMSGNLPSDTVLEFYTDFTLEFFSGAVNTVMAEAQTTKDYRTEIELVDFDGTSGSVTVRGLYGHANEMRAHCFDPYRNGTPTFEAAPVTINLNADGTVTLDRCWGTAGPVLSTSWQKMTLKAAGNEIKTPLTASERNLWFERNVTDYTSELLVAENDLGSVANTNDDMLVLHTRIESGDFKPITGTWSITSASADNTDTPNSHWNRDEATGSGVITISFAPHHILPVIYKYNEFYEGLPERIKYVIKTGEPQSVESLTLTIPVDGVAASKPTFNLENYGNGDMGAGRGNYIYVAGDVTGVDDVFIVRGLLTDYSADDMSDTEKGHRYGLLISDGRYDTSYVPKSAQTTSATTSDEVRADIAAATDSPKHINVLVPNADIPGNTASASVFTLYGRTATTAGYRFDQLGVLNRVTTGVADIAATPTAAYLINGRTITAIDPTSGTAVGPAPSDSSCSPSTFDASPSALSHDRTTPVLVVSDIYGRTIATLATGQSATLAPGHYLVTNADGTAAPGARVLIR